MVFECLENKKVSHMMFFDSLFDRYKMCLSAKTINYHPYTQIPMYGLRQPKDEIDGYAFPWKFWDREWL